MFDKEMVEKKKLIVPDDLQSTFITLADNDLLPKDFAIKIAPIVGLRNRVVHRYDTLNKQTFIEKLKSDFGDFKEYIIYAKKLI